MSNTEEIKFIFRDYAVSICPYIHEQDGHEVTKYHAFAVQNRFAHLFDEIIAADRFGNEDTVLKVLQDNGYQVESIEDCEDCLTLKTGHPFDDLVITITLTPDSDFHSYDIEDEDWINPHAMIYQICRELEIQF